MKLAAAALLAMLSAPALAETTITETVVHDTTTKVAIKLDSSTVLCSAADYGALFLKVLIPELAPITLLDHQNTGAGAPCVAAGLCQPGNMPDDIIDARNPTEEASIHVKAVRIDVADSVAKTCETSLREDVHVTIRGIAFTHERWASLGTRPFADCAKAAPAPTPEAKTDGAEPAAKAETGGCNTSGGSAGALFALGLGAVLARRRRLA